MSIDYHHTITKLIRHTFNANGTVCNPPTWATFANYSTRLISCMHSIRRRHLRRLSLALQRLHFFHRKFFCWHLSSFE